MISHASQALRELVHRYKPVSVEFSAAAENLHVRKPITT